MLISIDVVCGPLLTLAVFNPLKPRRELTSDLSVIVLLQVLALGYGLYTLSLARPIALVYEIDRFRVVSMADIPEQDASKIPEWINLFGVDAPKVIGLRLAAKGSELVQSLEVSMQQGVEPSQRPERWQDYSLNHAQVLLRSHSIAQLKELHPDAAPLINSALKQANLTDSTARWLPVVGRLASDWVVFLNAETAMPMAFAHLNGL